MVAPWWEPSPLLAISLYCVISHIISQDFIFGDGQLKKWYFSSLCMLWKFLSPVCGVTWYIHSSDYSSLHNFMKMEISILLPDLVVAPIHADQCLRWLLCMTESHTFPHHVATKNCMVSWNYANCCTMYFTFRMWVNKAELGAILNEMVWFYHKIHSLKYAFFSLTA